MILFAVPYLRKRCHRHHQDVMEWYASNRDKHNLKQHFIDARPLHEAQATAVERARELGCSHILFSEEDQWGYPENGLEILLKADKDVVGFQTYSRKYPHTSLFLTKTTDASLLLPRPKRQLTEDEKKAHRLVPLQAPPEGEIMAKVDLITWAFTLVKTEVFDKIQNPFEVWGHQPTDSYFSQYCADAGIDIWGHFGTVIAHGEFGPEEIPARRRAFEVMQ